MNKILIKIGLKLVGRLLDGKKTYIVAAGKILFGIAIAISYAFPEYSFLPADPDKAVEVIAAGYGMLFGLGTAAQRSAAAKTQKKIEEIYATQTDTSVEYVRRGKFINPGHGTK